MRNSFPEVTAMSQMGQKAKYSPRANVFRSAPESGHPTCALRPVTDPDLLILLGVPANHRS